MNRQLADDMRMADLAAFGRSGSRSRTPRLNPTPYWLQNTDPGETNVELPGKTDVAIVGSGFTGLSAALTLVRRGRSVVVLESDRLGAGASTRNGGQIGSGNQKFRVARLIEMLGREKAVALLREGVDMLDYIEHLISREAIECHFTRCGRFRGAVHPAHYDAMARDMDDLRRYAGVESHPVPKSEQHREVASDYFHGGSVLPDDASLHPGLYHKGLVERLNEAGAILKEMSPVSHVEATTGGFTVRTAGHKLHASKVIIATNGYTGKLIPYLKKRIVQVQSAMISTGPMPPKLIADMMPSGRMYGNTARVFSYFRASPTEPRILWGGRIGRLYKPGAAAAYSHLARDLLKVFPTLKDVPVTNGWSGKIGYTFDEFPHLGKTAEGMFFAMGYCGTGVSRATFFGHKIALQLLEDPDGHSEFDDLGFPSHALNAFAGAAVPAFESWYRVRDHLNF